MPTPPLSCPVQLLPPPPRAPAHGVGNRGHDAGQAGQLGVVLHSLHQSLLGLGLRSGTANQRQQRKRNNGLHHVDRAAYAPAQTR